MKKILFLTIAAISFAGQSVKAQHLKPEGQEYMNKFSTAPAYAGYNGNDEGFIGYRSFMTGIDGATKLLTADVNGDLGESMGYGVQIINEKSGNFSNFYAGITYAYHIRFSEESGLSFAVTPAIIRSAYNLAGAKTFGSTTDPVLANEAGLSGGGFDAGFSVMLKMGGLNFSAYVPRLICQDLKFQNGILNSDREIFSNLSYAIENDKWEFEPAAEVCYSLGMKELEWKAALNAKYNERAWVSVGYQSTKWLALGMGFSATNRIAFNYQYLYGTSEIAKTCGGTHEIGIGFLIQKGKTHKKPTVFFEEKEKAKNNEIEKLKEEVKKLEEEVKTAKINDVLENDEKRPSPEPEHIEEEEDIATNSKDWEPPVQMYNVTFASGTSILNRSSYSEIDAFISLINDKEVGDQPVSDLYMGRKVLIVVTAEQGDSKKFNKKLALERAEKIKAYMISKGVSDIRISTRGIAGKIKNKGADNFENNNVKICRSKAAENKK